MKQVFELKNISEETQLVLNENLEKVEVEAGETFRTTERSYLKNYTHIFALATDETEKKAKKSDSKASSKKAKDQAPVSPEVVENPAEAQEKEVVSKMENTTEEAVDNGEETETEEAPETTEEEAETA